MLNALCGSVTIAQTPFDERGAVDPAGIDTLVDFHISRGTCLLHGGPESPVGGPPAPVRDGEPIRLDVSGQRLDLLVEADALERSPPKWTPPPRRAARGHTALFLDRVRRAGEGSDIGVLDHGPPTPGHEIH